MLNTITFEGLIQGNSDRLHHDHWQEVGPTTGRRLSEYDQFREGAGKQERQKSALSGGRGGGQGEAGSKYQRPSNTWIEATYQIRAAH